MMFFLLLMFDFLHELAHLNLEVLEVYTEVSILAIVAFQDRNEYFFIGFSFMLDTLYFQIVLSNI